MATTAETPSPTKGGGNSLLRRPPSDKVEIIRSNKGGLKLIHRGYMYTVHKRRQSGGIRWRCTQRSLYCKGSISTGNGTTKVNMPHNHVPDPHSVALARCKHEEVDEDALIPDSQRARSPSVDEIDDDDEEEEEDHCNNSDSESVATPSSTATTTKHIKLLPRMGAPPPKTAKPETSNSAAAMTKKEQQQQQHLNAADAEEVCLRWNSHHHNMVNTFPALLQREQFVDVTLCTEGQTIRCHRLVLSSCSTYFEEILSGITPLQHPVIFLKGTPFWILKSLIDFMYIGEAHIEQSKLQQILEVAEALKIKGLTGSKTQDPPHKKKAPSTATNSTTPTSKVNTSAKKEMALSEKTSTNALTLKVPPPMTPITRHSAASHIKVGVAKDNSSSSSVGQQQQHQQQSTANVTPTMTTRRTSEANAAKDAIDGAIRLHQQQPQQQLPSQPQPQPTPPVPTVLQLQLPQHQYVPHKSTMAAANAAKKKQQLKRKSMEIEPPPTRIQYTSVTRKGTKSRPIVKPPRYYHTEFENDYQKSQKTSVDSSPSKGGGATATNNNTAHASSATTKTTTTDVAMDTATITNTTATSTKMARRDSGDSDDDDDTLDQLMIADLENIKSEPIDIEEPHMSFDHFLSTGTINFDTEPVTVTGAAATMSTPPPLTMCVATNSTPTNAADIDNVKDESKGGNLTITPVAPSIVDKVETKIENEGGDDAGAG